MITIDYVIGDRSVRDRLLDAWTDATPGPTGGHETGGFIVVARGGDLQVARWPDGGSKAIVVPSHTDCEIDGLPVIATFHTHPNTGPEFEPEPSDTDVSAVMADVDLRAEYYVGEIVLSAYMVYVILPNGGVLELGSPVEVLNGGDKWPLL